MGFPPEQQGAMEGFRQGGGEVRMWFENDHSCYPVQKLWLKFGQGIKGLWKERVGMEIE